MSIYIFDTNSLSSILNHYYPSRFPTFWKKFGDKISAFEVISVREVYKELSDHFEKEKLTYFTEINSGFFSEPNSSELSFITEIYSVKHFQHNLENKKLLKGGAFADPFIIAKAKILNATVVTEEYFKPNGAKIPNICEHFSIPFLSLEGFLQNENWTF